MAQWYMRLLPNTKCAGDAAERLRLSAIVTRAAAGVEGERHMTPAQRDVVDSLLRNQPRLGNARIAQLVGRGVGEHAVASRRAELGIPANPDPFEKQRPPKIGDKLPLPPDFDYGLYRSEIAKQRYYRQVISSDSGDQAALAARKGAALRAEMHEKRRLPVEQAKDFLRKKGFVPVATLPEEGHIVGHHRFPTDKVLLKFAKAKGWARG